ncbi:ubiquitin C-terminal hydrolase L3 [Eremomyces bilateralis CBS 781.70]|uniref:Ubiquitin carboxyl-terminal hydrolase n=1 Tax=Eremomyces bilateralis CBS 781.70 TaxID=1392243 RepID=A0A6G1G306_9PEZI|nr:ubiquitin C-terminal hydrolase L3 [Eremomyces bilateralis CBS 781.70]KAF1812398.1 ubiquitin C-terminal hydrolase L3 [Eremomyces bilateralis CBS 781.70]
MADPDTVIDESGKKVLIALENNPEVLSGLAARLGVSDRITFHDVLSLDRDFLAHIPRPCHALIIMVPAPVYHAARDEFESTIPEYTGSGSSEPVMWFRQTIGNACGLHSLLHALTNGPLRSMILPGSLLSKLVEDAEPLKAGERAHLLHNSEALERAHQESARLGDTEAPVAVVEFGHHFVTFVKGSDGGLWEMNGGMNGPVKRGELVKGQDALSEKALNIGARDFLDVGKKMGRMDFSLVAVCSDLDD